MRSLQRLAFWGSILAIIAIPTSAVAAPVERGEELHNQHCTGCHADMTGGHGVALYTRAQRRVNTLPALEAQVRRCALGKDLRWSDAEVAAVTRYLDAQYYQFGG